MTFMSATNAVYRERNQVVAALSKVFPSGKKRTKIEGWDDAWQGCVYIDLPTGQVSWHYHERDADMFSHLPPYEGEWDGHDTPEKYARLAALSVSLPQSRPVVKALEWRRGYCDDQVRISQATTLGGVYQVRMLRGEIWLDRPAGSKSPFSTTEAAVQAAQEDHEQMVLALLASYEPQHRAIEHDRAAALAAYDAAIPGQLSERLSRRSRAIDPAIRSENHSPASGDRS